MNTPGIVLNQQASEVLDAFVKAPAHAVLLAGPQGTGKTHIANALAATLLGTGEEMLVNHGYFRIIAAEKGTITIEQIRELINFFRLKVPGKAAIKRVAIIEDSESMGHEAQNALLKLLEEPPKDSVLILTSSQSDHLLPTIRSRTQRLQLGNPETEALKKHFVAQGYEEQKVVAALLRSGENVAAAQSILSGDGSDEDVVGLVKQVLSGSSYDRLLLVDSLAKQKEAVIAFTDTLATVALASLQAAASKRSTSIERWKQILEASNTAQEALERSGNAKLVLTELMLGL